MKYKKYILNSVELELLFQLSRTGITTFEQISKYYKLNKKELTNLSEHGYISLYNFTVRGSCVTLIKMNRAGGVYCKKNLGVKHCYQSQSNHAEHDIKLTECYCRLNSRLKQSWQNESELLEELHLNYPSFITTDSVCIDARIGYEGHYIGIEARGKSYTTLDIKRKEEVALKYLKCISLEVI